jgi:uncharacterized protein with NAD-binding domain and iron-sulfur cluster
MTTEKPGERSVARERIAIIGGGPSALTAAYWLTSTPELRARYDITVYQMGWRLGGKGASGRNRAQADRVEEHGLHIIFGFYQNFFAMIREVYAELKRAPGSPLATWREAFHPLSAGVMEDNFRGEWRPWIQPFPRNREVPGRGPALNGPIDYALMLMQVLLGVFVGWRTQLRMMDQWFPTGSAWENSTKEERPEETFGSRLFIAVLNGSFRACAWIDRYLRPVTFIVEGLYTLLWRAVHPAATRYARSYRVWTGVDFAISIFRGIVRDRLWEPASYAAIDEWDFREWLGSHGAHRDTCWSPYTRAIYDAAFSYADGRASEERISASVALRTLVRMLFSYKGAIYYKMQAGMGDTVFGPMYTALKARGVEFRFFHKAQALHLDEAGTRIERIEIQQQADLKTGEPGSYAPLYDVGGLPSWPSEPLYEQLADADRLRGIDLESYYTGYNGVRTITLEAGRDFDTVLLGTPVQTLPFLCHDLPRWNERWRRMIQEVKAVQTLSFQVWLSRTTEELGWAGPALPLLSLYVQPYNTWSDMSQVLKREAWPPSDTPRSVSYFTGAQPGPDAPPPPDDRDFPVRMTANARAAALTFMQQNFTTLMPGAVSDDAPPAVRWDLLVAVEPAPGGEARFETQYWRSNCDPHERCTLALPGTGKFRLAAGDTGCDNLFITGDWIDNGIHVACLEGAIMGGIYAARAVSGVDFPVVGEMLNGAIFGR